MHFDVILRALTTLVVDLLITIGGDLLVTGWFISRVSDEHVVGLVKP